MAEESPFNVDPRVKQARMSGSRPFWVVIALIVLLVGGFLLYVVYEYEQARLEIGPLLQASEDGTLVVAWRTVGEPDTALVVNLGDAEDEPGQTLVVQPRLLGAQYVAPMPELLINHPQAAYWIRSRMLVFYRSQGPWTVSQPRVEEPFRFVVFGHSGTNLHRRTLATTMLQTHPHLVLHLGDLVDRPEVFPRGAMNVYEEQVFGPYNVLLNIMPFMPVPGQQAAAGPIGSAFDELFVLPDNGPPGLPAGRVWWFDYGTARFVAIDTSVAPELLEAEVVPWLRRVLTDTRTKWKFVLTEASPYAAGGPSPRQEAVRRILVPAFEAAGVNMVLSAGKRRFERTAPLLQDRPVPPGEGIVYVTTGAAARSLEEISGPLPPSVVAHDSGDRSFSLVELAGDEMRFRQVGAGGEVIDELLVPSEASVQTPQPATQPAAAP